MLGRQLSRFACSSSPLWRLVCSLCWCPSFFSWLCLFPVLCGLALLFSLRVAFSPSSALPSPSLRCAEPVSCGGAPFQGVLRVPQLCRVRSVWLSRHLCPVPLTRLEWRVFCATCCGQRFWARYMRHGKGFDPVWGFFPFTPCGLPLSLPLSSQGWYMHLCTCCTCDPTTTREAPTPSPKTISISGAKNEPKASPLYLLVLVMTIFPFLFC